MHPKRYSLRSILFYFSAAAALFALIGRVPEIAILGLVLVAYLDWWPSDRLPDLTGKPSQALAIALSIIGLGDLLLAEIAWVQRQELDNSLVLLGVVSAGSFAMSAFLWRL